MWWFGKKSLVQQGVFQGMTDCHSHILPGVDDGVQTRKESLAILARMEEMGVSEVWLTPHIQEYIPNETEELRKKFAALCEVYEGKIKLHLAAEYMMDTLLDERLEANDLLPHGDEGKRLLVETSYWNPPFRMEDTLFRIKQKGLTPMLAHPERYAYMDEEQYMRLKQMGILFQMNLGSLLGLYGKTARKKAQWLLAEGAYEFYGTDIHDSSLLEAFFGTKVPKIGLEG